MTQQQSTKTTARRGWFDRQTVAITAVYSAAWFIMLLNGGRYWDDWCLYKISAKATFLMASQIGQLWQPFYSLLLAWMPGVEYAGHAATFLLFWAAALLLNRILRHTPGLDADVQTIVPLLFAVFPVNAARFAFVDFSYTISVVAFFLAWYLLALDLRTPRLAWTVAAGLLFFFALTTTNSLIAFILLVPLWLVWVHWEGVRDRSVWRRLLVRYGFIVALPIAAFVFREVFLRPWGLYQGYNAVSIGSLRESVRLLPIVAWTSFVSLLPAAGWSLLLAIPLYLVLRRYRDASKASLRQSLAVLGSGVLAFFLGVYPYLAVGKLPQPGWAYGSLHPFPGHLIGRLPASLTPDGWDSRHQVLVPLGAALMLYGGVMLLARCFRMRKTAATAVLLALVVAFVVADIGTSLMYQADWYKQLSLTQQMKASAQVRAGNFFVLRDKTIAANAFARRYEPYELTGMMYSVFGDTTRFASDDTLVPAWLSLMPKYGQYEQYHFQQYRPPARPYVMTVVTGTKDVTKTRTVLGLLWRQVLAPAQFNALIGHVVTLKVEPAQ